jgi:hypothetical protein
MDERMGSRFGRLAVPALVLVLGVVAAACGSGSSSTAAKAPAGAKENATYIGSAVCKDVKSGAVVACALDTIGPGGGYVFYDHGSQQSWGRFLEVAPWKWDPTSATPSKCVGGCGADTTSVLKPELNQTQDRQIRLSCEVPKSFATETSEALGTGAANTAKIIADPACQPSPTTALDNALALVTAYRGGGLSDWFLPSKDELVLLCNSPGRNYVGGFNADWYHSSTTLNTGDKSEKVSWLVDFGDCRADQKRWWWHDRIFDGTRFVRPIRAFS